MPDARQIIRARVEGRGSSFSALSMMAGKNVAYLQRYVEQARLASYPASRNGFSRWRWISARRWLSEEPLPWRLVRAFLCRAMTRGSLAIPRPVVTRRLYPRIFERITVLVLTPDTSLSDTEWKPSPIRWRLSCICQGEAYAVRMDLLDRIRAARETERLALLPQPGFTDPIGVVDGIGPNVPMSRIMAAAAFEDQIASLVQDASDADLLQAYRRAHGEPRTPEADTLLVEIERRKLKT